MRRERLIEATPWVIALVVVPFAGMLGQSIIFQVYGRGGSFLGGGRSISTESPGIGVLHFWQDIRIWLVPFLLGAATMLIVRKRVPVALLTGIASAALVWAYAVIYLLLYLLLGGDPDWN